ncbi:LPS export ABC transporter periplasmic protein LptC, partial [Crocinitomix sp.]|nr:LPS export ABC transporter periplasmic protein LptC [Crocinitomix sp.]
MIAALLLSAVFFPRIGYSQDNLIRLVFAEDVVSSLKHINTTIAKGHVEFSHSGTRMFCDSAIFFQDKNLVHAYSNVQINQGDTVNLFCDSLKFNGKTNISKLLSNVRFRDSDFLLVTDSLEFDGNNSIGYYTNHAKITSRDSELKLTSVKGYYYSQTKTFYFKDSVHVTDPKYELFSDTLEYRTNNSSAHFHGPTKIHFDSSTVDCNRGIYYSEEDRVQLWNGATINEPGRILYADSLLYNQKTDLGEGFCYVMMHDSTENIKFLSDYMLKKPKNTEVILRNSARIFQYGEVDTLYLSGDTITYVSDTLTNSQLSIIENNVAIVKGDLFIRCDSAYFSEQDSILKLHKEPIIWNTNTQLFADSIFTTYYDNEFHEMKMYYNSMIISEHENDTIHYDQLKGKFMTAKLDSGKITSVYIQQNAQTLYYPSETETDTAGVETQKLSGMNVIDCNEIILRFLDSEVQDIVFIDEPTGKM